MTRSDRVWTVPNAISLARLALVPVFAWLIATHRDVAAVGVLAVAGVSDWLDGVLARKLGQFSNLGRILDPAADRAFIVVTGVGLAWRGAVPWWFLALLLAREAFMAAVLLIVRSRGGHTPQVVFVGKAATLALMYAFPLLLLASLGGIAGRAAWVAGWAFAIWGVGLYWIAAVQYSRGLMTRPGEPGPPVQAPSGPRGRGAA
jgi:cardiolipin synthase